jgi:hypothetical protein
MKMEIEIKKECVVVDGESIEYWMLARAARQPDRDLRRRYMDIVDHVMAVVAYPQSVSPPCPLSWCPLTPRLGGTGHYVEWSGMCSHDEDRAHAAWQAWRVEDARRTSRRRAEVAAYHAAEVERIKQESVAYQLRLESLGADRIVHGSPSPGLATVYRGDEFLGYVRDF